MVSTITMKGREQMDKYRFYGWQTADICDEQGRTPRDYYDILSGLWCSETCAPRLRDKWSEDNRTLGQCSITAFLMQDIYGGRVLGIPTANGVHCFNVVDDCLFDLASEQFGDTVLDYSYASEQSREQHFADADKKARYELLKKLLTETKKIEYDGMISICDFDWGEPAGKEML